MSSFNELDITCEQCGEEFKGTVWTAVHAKEDPELKDLLLGGELNLIMCPSCSHVAYQEHFILYQDPAAELIAYIYPPSEKNDEEFLRTSMLSAFKDVQSHTLPQDQKNYEPILVFGLENFVEMMEEEAARAAQSQIAQAICSAKTIPYQLLKPAEARRLKMMRVLPGKSRGREDVQAGLVQLLKENPALDRYATLSEQLPAELFV